MEMRQVTKLGILKTHVGWQGSTHCQTLAKAVLLSFNDDDISPSHQNLSVFFG
jgi:hypothetical protein